MSPSRPIQPFDFQPEPIWWDGPFNPTLICPKILLNMYVKSVKSKKYAKIFDWEVYVEAHDVWSLGSTEVNFERVLQISGLSYGNCATCILSDEQRLQFPDLYVEICAVQTSW
jgi:hypothetical protein